MRPRRGGLQFLRPSGGSALKRALRLVQQHFQRLLSPLLGRILLVNVLPLALLAGLLLSINQFQTGLLEADVTALREQGHIYAGALGQSAVRRVGGGPVLDVGLARPLLTELVASSHNAHARLFGPDGRLLVDSHQGKGPHGSAARSSEPEPPRPRGEDAVDAFYGWILSWLPLNSRTGPVPFEGAEGEGDGRGRPGVAPPPLGGLVELPPYIRRTAGHQLVITVVEPVMHGGHTVGVIQLTRRDPEIDRSLFVVRSAILTLMFGALVVTVLLSWYLFHTIASPLRRLVRSSREMREPGHGRADCVPAPLLGRRDEIGVLARALRVSTLALWARLDDTERFAAEVSHELKNPLSSIRSALETLPRLPNGEPRKRLLTILTDDVQRLERLISDISEASRIEGELSRGRHEAVDILPLLSVLVEMHETTRAPGDPHLVLEVEPGASLGAARSKGEGLPSFCVMAVGDRLVQVIRNLISNALSFSPPDGQVTLRIRSVSVPQNGASSTALQAPSLAQEVLKPATSAAGSHKMREMVEIEVSDQGPGVPPAKLENIFDRFYSERPGSEHFGQHSGLGLAISRQIIQALDGTLQAENIYCAGPPQAQHSDAGLPSTTAVPAGPFACGARFIVRLPRCACPAHSVGEGGEE
ncbi:HAMP domain-containing protein [Oecophyllibacter saccharovorans]|uniref:stimulus-sensing domain-containing protein n=1 Tax=Oecophyllibacter saccharovorans TaxID=2558360 RepID=UPI00116FD7E6|nr:HAMP domain-containing protein [Oecophyllibacter saccharovorans]